MFAKKNRYSFKNKLPKNILNSQSFTIRYEKNDEGLKTAVVVSKRVDARATVRNKVKRRIIETVKKKIGKGKNLSLVIYAKASAVDSNNLETELESAISKLK